jgi:hypothetical protein
MAAPLPDLLVLAAVAVTALADADTRPYVVGVLATGAVVFGATLVLLRGVDNSEPLRYIRLVTKKAPQSGQDHGASQTPIQ